MPILILIAGLVPVRIIIAAINGMGYQHKSCLYPGLVAVKM